MSDALDSGLDRRSFLKRGALLAAAAGLGLPSWTPTRSADPKKRAIRKGIMYATIGVKGSIMEKFQQVKAAGFEGIEAMSHLPQEEVLKARDATGLAIPSVCGSKHWDKPLTHPNPAVRAEGLQALEHTLRDAKRYGAASVLLVPGVVNKEVSYAACYDRSQEMIRKAVPLAEELRIKIAIENVWNHFLLSPLEAARYIDEFNSPWVGWHFDVGNIINYGWPEHWVRILNKRIVVLHIKEFSRDRRDKEGLWKGFDVEFEKGTNDWPAVMTALDEIGFSGWGIAEQGGAGSPEGLKKLATEMDRIFAS